MLIQQEAAKTERGGCSAGRRCASCSSTLRFAFAECECGRIKGGGGGLWDGQLSRTLERQEKAIFTPTKDKQLWIPKNCLRKVAVKSAAQREEGGRGGGGGVWDPKVSTISRNFNMKTLPKTPKIFSIVSLYAIKYFFLKEHWEILSSSTWKVWPLCKKYDS